MWVAPKDLNGHWPDAELMFQVRQACLGQVCEVGPPLSRDTFEAERYLYAPLEARKLPTADTYLYRNVLRSIHGTGLLVAFRRARAAKLIVIADDGPGNTDEYIEAMEKVRGGVEFGRRITTAPEKQGYRTFVVMRMGGNS